MTFSGGVAHSISFSPDDHRTPRQLHGDRRIGGEGDRVEHLRRTRRKPARTEETRATAQIERRAVLQRIAAEVVRVRAQRPVDEQRIRIACHRPRSIRFRRIDNHIAEQHVRAIRIDAQETVHLQRRRTQVAWIVIELQPPVLHDRARSRRRIGEIEIAGHRRANGKRVAAQVDEARRISPRNEAVVRVADVINRVRRHADIADHVLSPCGSRRNGVRQRTAVELERIVEINMRIGVERGAGGDTHHAVRGSNRHEATLVPRARVAVGDLESAREELPFPPQAQHALALFHEPEIALDVDETVRQAPREIEMEFARIARGGVGDRRRRRKVGNRQLVSVEVDGLAARGGFTEIAPVGVFAQHDRLLGNARDERVARLGREIGPRLRFPEAELSLRTFRRRCVAHGDVFTQQLAVAVVDTEPIEAIARKVAHRPGFKGVRTVVRSEERHRAPRRVGCVRHQTDFFAVCRDPACCVVRHDRTVRFLLERKRRGRRRFLLVETRRTDAGRSPDNEAAQRVFLAARTRAVERLRERKLSCGHIQLQFDAIRAPRGEMRMDPLRPCRLDVLQSRIAVRQRHLVRTGNQTTAGRRHQGDPHFHFHKHNRLPLTTFHIAYSIKPKRICLAHRFNTKCRVFHHRFSPSLPTKLWPWLVVCQIPVMSASVFQSLSIFQLPLSPLHRAPPCGWRLVRLRGQPI